MSGGTVVSTIPISELYRDLEKHQARPGFDDRAIEEYVNIVQNWQAAEQERRSTAFPEGLADDQRKALAVKRKAPLPPPFRDPVEVTVIQDDPDAPLVLRLQDGVPEGTLALVDGHHRVRACELAGRDEIEARFTPGDKYDALVRAAKANAANGLRLGPKGQRKAFRMFIDGRGNHNPDGSRMDYREIARALGGTRAYSTMHAWMKVEFPRLARAMGNPHKGRLKNPERKGPDLGQRVLALDKDPVLAIVNAWKGLAAFDPQTQRALIAAGYELVMAGERLNLPPADF